MVPGAKPNQALWVIERQGMFPGGRGLVAGTAGSVHAHTLPGA